MPDTITIRKGLDIPIGGAAELRLTDARSISTYAVKPTDFVGFTPRLTVEEGDLVCVGDALFVDKHDERIRERRETEIVGSGGGGGFQIRGFGRLGLQILANLTKATNRR